MTETYEQFRELNRRGWNIQNTKDAVHFNGGSESFTHLLAKVTAAEICRRNGYSVASEVETDTGKEADILAYGHADRLPIVIELENDVQEDTVKRKLKHYHVGSVREVFVVDLDKWTDTHPDSLAQLISDETGLDYE